MILGLKLLHHQLILPEHRLSFVEQFDCRCVSTVPSVSRDLQKLNESARYMGIAGLHDVSPYS